MADDAHGRPKPPARRRRMSRSTAPAEAQDAVQDVAPDLEQAPPPVDPTSDADAAAASDSAVVDIWPMPDSEPGDRAVCPFLRSIDGQGALGEPVDAPAAANRCAALAEAVPQSLRQQELVCLTTAHTSCPRYLRGATVETETPVARTITASRLTPATIGALALLAAAFSASVMFTFARGGLDLPVAGAIPSASAGAAVPSAEPSAAPSVEVSPAASASATPVPSETPSPSPSPTASPPPSLTPAPSVTPVPTSDRYALLKPCPDKPDCWIYRVRSGDNLFSIANYFGVPLATVKALNPWTANGLRAGRDLILPPPTR